MSITLPSHALGVQPYLSYSPSEQPNIVIINAGTNDANENVTPGGAGSRMNDILDDLWKAPGMADTCIMLSTLIPTTHPVGQITRLTINEQYRNLVRQRSGDGKCVYLADMDPNGGAWWNFDTDFSPLSASEKYHIHPNVRDFFLLTENIATEHANLRRTLDTGRWLPFSTMPSTGRAPMES